MSAVEALLLAPRRLHPPGFTISRALEKAGHVFGVTRERIRQIEAKALRKLRHPSRFNKLRDLLE